MGNIGFKKEYFIDAEMFGKASYFSAVDWNDFTRGICIAPSSALNDGINIIATDGFSLVIFNNSICDNSNFPHSSGGRIWIDCVYKKGKLTDFIKDCRNKAILKKHKNFKLTFPKKNTHKKCRIRFNNRQYTFKCGTDFPNIDSVISKIKIPLKNEAVGYNPKFIEKVKHLNLSWHKHPTAMGRLPDKILLSRCDNGELLAIKPGVIFLALPLTAKGKKKSAIGRFVRGISSESKDYDDLFSAALKKQAYKKEFGFLLANELQIKKASF